MQSAGVLPAYPNKVRVGLGLTSHSPRCNEHDGDDHEYNEEECISQVKVVYLVLQLPNCPLQQQRDYIDAYAAAFLEGPDYKPHACASFESVDRYQRFLKEEYIFGYAERDMAFFFRSKKIDMVKPAAELLQRLWQPPKLQKTEEELAKLLKQIRISLTGTQEFDSNPDTVMELINMMEKEDFLVLLARSIHLLPFEARKDSQAIFSCVLRFRPGLSTAEDTPALSYVVDKRPEVLIELCRGYAHKDSVSPCGMVLREILKHEAVAAIILYDQSQGDEPATPFSEIDAQAPQSGNGVFWDFFKYIDEGAFEVSADAFNTFKDILTKHKPLVAQFLTSNFDLFFQRYNTILIGSNSYVTMRQSIKLLGEILLDRTNYAVMTEYVTRGDHLKLCMNLLKDDRKMVQYEGFHVFKVFVANPNKSEAVKRILIQNRARLLRFLPPFLEDRPNDEQFSDEKAFLIRQIEQLPAQP